MSRARPLFWIFPLGLFIFFSCSTSKKGVLNQEYHTLTTKYNVLFNGKEAFNIGEQILEQAYEDNFYELLPVEPINLRGENIDESSIVPGFDRAEEKAVKAIQKHSMNINGNQYNRQIDEAYLLLGKARYYDRRFFPALEAFNFLLKSGANQSIFVEGKIWREKTNIRLQNHQLAIQNLKPIAKSLNFRKIEESSCTLAWLYLIFSSLNRLLISWSVPSCLFLIAVWVSTCIKKCTPPLRSKPSFIGLPPISSSHLGVVGAKLSAITTSLIKLEDRISLIKS